MSTFFPRQTVAWKVEEPPIFRRLTLSVLETGAVTGVVLRLFRSLWLTHGSSSWLFVGGYYALFAVLLFGMEAAHLGNYTIRHWVWRAPLFAGVVVVAEMLVSLVLIAAHREPMGTTRATYHDWPAMAADAFLYRMTAVMLFAVLLAGVVQLVRFLLLRHEHRDSTALAIHNSAEHKAP